MGELEDTVAEYLYSDYIINYTNISPNWRDEPDKEFWYGKGKAILDILAERVAIIESKSENWGNVHNILLGKPRKGKNKRKKK